MRTDETSKIPKMKRIQLNIRIPLYLKEFLQEWADRERKDMSSVVLEFIHAKWLERQLVPPPQPKET